MKRRHLSLGLALGLCLGLSACGIGQRQNPVASDSELGSTKPLVDEDKPAAYTTRSGDTLAGIAGRPEIYGDPALWPLLQGANPDSLAGKGSATPLKGGLALDVPRDASPEALAQAREQDRQIQAAAKGRHQGKHSAVAASTLKAVKSSAKFKPVVVAAKPQPAPTAVATLVAPAPAPVAHHSSGLKPLLLLLLLVLLALGAVLYAFTRRDNDDGA